MKLTLLPKTGLGKLSAWGIVVYIVSWILVAFLQPRWGGSGDSRSFLDWIFMLFVMSGIVGAFTSLFGGLITIVWREDRSLLGIIAFVLSIPFCVLLAGFFLGSYMV